VDKVQTFLILQWMVHIFATELETFNRPRLISEKRLKFSEIKYSRRRHLSSHYLKYTKKKKKKKIYVGYNFKVPEKNKFNACVKFCQLNLLPWEKLRVFSEQISNTGHLISTLVIMQFLRLDTKQVQDVVCKRLIQENMLPYSEESIGGHFASIQN
jgi:hypothetical protein